MLRMKYFVLLAYLVGLVAGFSAYIGDCSSAYYAYNNGHNTTGMTNRPYFLSGLPTTFTSSAPLTFTLAGPVKGYAIYASDLNGHRVGTWNIVDPNTVLGGAPCVNTIGHNNNTNTKTVVTFQWTPPTPPTTVIFQGNLVNKTGMFWYNMLPAPVMAAAPVTVNGVCTPYTTCALSGTQCGTMFDGCQTLNCGRCGANAVCTAGQCVVDGCVPTSTCLSAGVMCGTMFNNCTTINCGGCPTNQLCDPIGLQCFGPSMLVGVFAPVPVIPAPAVDPNALPRTVGIGVGVAVAVVVWILIMIIVAVYLVTRQKRVRRGMSQMGMGASMYIQPQMDPNKHYAPPLWARSMHRLTQVFGYKSPVQRQSSSVQMNEAEAPKPRAKGWLSAKVDPESTTAPPTASTPDVATTVVAQP